MNLKTAVLSLVYKVSSGPIIAKSKCLRDNDHFIIELRPPEASNLQNNLNLVSQIPPKSLTMCLGDGSRQLCPCRNTECPSRDTWTDTPDGWGHGTEQLGIYGLRYCDEYQKTRESKVANAYRIPKCIEWNFDYSTMDKLCDDCACRCPQPRARSRSRGSSVERLIAGRRVRVRSRSQRERHIDIFRVVFYKVSLP